MAFALISLQEHADKDMIHTYSTHVYIYIYVYTYVCVCVFVMNSETMQRCNPVNNDMFQEFVLPMI